MFSETQTSSDIGEIFVDINIKEDKNKNKEIDNIVSYLQMHDNDTNALINKYTELLMDDNVVGLFTKLSHHTVFMKHFPEFYEKNINDENVINCQQNSKYHKYGVFRHILHTVELVGRGNIQRNSYEMKILKWTMFLHDIGKPYVKVIDENGNESFAGHDDRSVEIAQNILDRYAFNEEEKNIILTLIKYHDRYLNEGELTFNNMSFLAQQLQDRKDLFYMLIDVKIADSKAKTLEVYNKFMSVIEKYYNFANYYFVNTSIGLEKNIIGDEEVVKEPVNQITNTLTETIFNSGDSSTNFEIGESDFKKIYDQLLERKQIYPVYQPIIDISEGSFYGFEAFNRINYARNVKILDFIQKSKEYSKYDKVQQLLFVNSVDNFIKIKTKCVDKIFISIDVESYMKYPNKPRIYEMMQKLDIIVQISNYDNVAISKLQNCIGDIRKNGGKVLLNYFGTNKFTLNDLELLEVDYVKYDLILLNSFEKSEENKNYLRELSTFCLSRDIELVVMGVETMEQLSIIKDMGIRYIQGYVFGKPSLELDKSEGRVKEVLKLLDADESIV